MSYIIYGLIAAFSTTFFYRVGDIIRKQIPEQLRFLVGIVGVLSLQVLVITLVFLLHLGDILPGNKFLNLGLSIPVSVGFGLGIFKGLEK